MGFIRKSSLTLLLILTLLSLLITNSLFVLFYSLRYENVQSELPLIAEDKGILSITDQQYNTLRDNCINKTEYSFYYSEYDLNVQIPCEKVNEGKNAILSYGANEILKDVYYNNNSKGLISIFSIKTYNSLKNLFYIFLAVSLLLIIILYFIFENKHNFLISTGILFIISSLPFSKLGWFISIVPFDYADKLLSMFLSASFKVFLAMLFLGWVIAGVGIGLKFWSFGEKIWKTFSKSSKDEED
ncbi:MAG: hypothetical protein AABX30_00150 [Nanoarchaeota archaeon]